MADSVCADGPTDGAPSLDALQAHHPDEFLASPEQEPFALLSMLSTGDGVGTEYVLLRMQGPLDVAALNEAVVRLFEANEAWRSSWRFVQGRVMARVWPSAALGHDIDGPVQQVDLRDMPLQAAQEALQAEVRRRVQAPALLPGVPCIRCTLFRIAPEEHALLFGGHHLALDGYALFVLLPRQLRQAYRAACNGREWSGPSGLSYREFCTQSRAVLHERSEVHRGYWAQALADPPAPLALPTDRVRGAHRSYAGQRRYRRLSPELQESLRSRASALGVSFVDLWMAGLALMLARYADAHDLLIAVPNANRRRPELSDLFACVLRTATVRCRPQEELTVLEFVQQIRRSKRAAYQHLDPNPEAYLDQAASAGGTARPQVFLNYQPEAMDFRLDGLSVQAERRDPGWTTYDLGFDLADEAQGLLCAVEFDTQLFDPATALRLLDQLITIVERLSEHPDTTLESLPIAMTLQRAPGLAGPGLQMGPHETVLQVVQQVVSQQGSEPAILCCGQAKSYAQIWARAKEIAAALQQQGVGAEDFVVLLLKDPVQAVVSMLGVLRAGAAYVPLGPGMAKDHLAHVLQDTQPKVLLVDAEGEAAVAGLEPHLTRVCVSEVPEGVVAELQEVQPSQPAYMIYTSGSTGTPKGVLVGHDNLHAQLQARLQSYGPMGPRGLTLQSLSFDSAIAFIYGSLASGGTLVLPTWQERRDPGSVLRLIEAAGVTHIDTIPCMYAELIDRDSERVMAGLKDVVLGGEALTHALASRHFDSYPKVRLHNEYGPTETTVFSSVAHLDALPERITIGEPIPGTWCYILDSKGRSVPEGVPGELYIGGPGVTRGYHGRPDLTHAAFVPNPFGLGGPRLYRTGDRVRIDADQQLDFLGRVDRQVKIRGYRVELGHVESALGQLPNVLQAAVVVQRRQEAAPALMAFATTEAEVTAPELRASLRQVLPAYMVPQRVQILPALPTTAAGKVDHAALLKVAEHHELDAELEQYPDDFPRTQAEDQLACLWEQLLERAHVGRQVDFFEAGGDSIMAMRMLGRVQAKFGVEVPLSVFVHERTIERLAARLHADGLVQEESLVVKYREGTRPPFWVMHAVGGHIVFARRMLPYLADEQPLYGIQARGLDGRQAAFRSLEEMADHYTDLIVEHQPQGPYLLGGPSYGGLIAWAVAQRLERRGAEIRLLALLDAWAPGYPIKLPRRRRVAQALVARKDALRDLRPGTLVDAARAAIAATRDDEGYRQYDPMDRFGAEARDPQIQAMMSSTESVYGIMQSFMDRYAPTPADFPVQLFRARPPTGWPGVRFDDPLNGWARLCRQSPGVMYFDCDHHALLEEPMVRKVVRHLNYLIESAMDL